MIPFEVQLSAKKVRVVLFRESRQGAFYARWWWRGRPYSRTTGHDYEREARVRAREMVEEVAGQVSRTPMTLRAALNVYREQWPDCDHKTRSLFTLERFAAHGKNESLNLAAVTFDNAKFAVLRYLDMRKPGLSKQSIINEQRHLSRFFSWLAARGHVPWKEVNPASRRTLAKDLPRVAHKPRPPVSPKDLAIMLKAARRKTIWPTVLLCLTAGMRAAGALRCRWSDLNFETGKLKVTEKGRDRYIPLHPWTLDELRAWKRKKVDGEWIVGRDSRLMWHHMQQIRRTHKLGPEVTMQGCRRTFIAMCMRAGVSAELVASLCGNSVAVIEKHYFDLRTMDAEHVHGLLDFSVFTQGRSKTVVKKA